MAEIEWRRRWKPDLASCSWRNLDVQIQGTDDGKRYLIKGKFTDNSYEVLITDLSRFWCEELSNDALKKRISKLNPALEAPLTKVLDQIQVSLGKPCPDTQVTLAQKDDKLHLKISSQLGGMPFSFHLLCGPSPDDQGREHLVVPLMAMVGELYRQQGELTALLAAKDREIEDYRAQGSATSRKHLQTTPFDSLAFRNTMLTSKGFEKEVETYGEQAFTSKGQELYREIVTKRLWLQTGNSGAGEDPPTVSSGDCARGAPSVESWAHRLPTSLGAPSPSKRSPSKSPASSGGSSAEPSPTKDSEFLRRQALERKMEQEEAKKNEKVPKKKKKLKF